MIHKLFKIYIGIGMKFYFKKLIVKGAANIPQKEAVLFVANHQNAFLDALLVSVTHKKPVHYLVRADIFRKPAVKWLLSLVNMMPIYRIRDGWNSLSNNKKIFQSCYEIFQQKKTLLIFPEGNHGLERRLRPLSKGFTRIVFGALEEYPNLNIKIIPVGINYDIHDRFRGNVSLYYGKPIDANQFFNKENIPLSATLLKKEVASKMQQVITHISDKENYKNIITTLEKQEIDYLKPLESNKKIKEIIAEKLFLVKENNLFHSSKKQNYWKIFYPLVFLNNLFPFGIWNFIHKGISDPVMIPSIRFAFGIFVFPIFYIFQSWIVYSFFGLPLSAIYFLFSLFSVGIMQQKEVK